MKCNLVNIQVTDLPWWCTANCVEFSEKR